MALHVVDVSDTTPEMVWSDIDIFKIRGTCFVIILNKMELNPYTKPEEYYKEGLISAKNIITTSALNKMNIEALKEHLYHSVMDSSSTDGSDHSKQ